MSTDFPPSFQDNPFAYGFSLFSMMLITVVSTAILLTIVLEPRHRRRIDRELDNMICLDHSIPFATTLGLYRMKVVSLLTMIVMGVLPDVVFLLSWGEASPRVINIIWTTDRLFDGLAILPFLVFTSGYMLSGGSVANHLGEVPRRVELYPRWVEIRRHFKSALLVLFITAGVTIYKASA